jgi:hypothetical protein
MECGQDAFRMVRRHRLREMQTPIACSLELNDATEQLGEWHSLLDRVVDRAERISSTRLDLSLLPNVGLDSLLRIAQREKECCPFFTFTVHIWADCLVLAIEVPDQATGILDQLTPEPREL